MAWKYLCNIYVMISYTVSREKRHHLINAANLPCKMKYSLTYSEYLSQVRISMSLGQGQGHSRKNNMRSQLDVHICRWSAFDWNAICHFSIFVTELVQEFVVSFQTLHCVSKKRHPFYFRKNLAKYYSISIIFGSSVPEEILNKSMHVYPPHLFTVLTPYLVKLWSTYLCLHCFKEWPFYCAQQVCQMLSEFDNF